MAIASLWVVWTHPLAVCFLAIVLWGLVAVAGWLDARHFAQLAQERSGESICQFARSIDCRGVDTWVVRAVYEELQTGLPGQVGLFPLRVTDRLQKDLRLDADDLDLSLVPDIAQRAGRDLSSTQGNPFYGKVSTVGDLVHFLNAQPRIQSAAA
ncbi:hypothetical protein [Acidovorax soli]|uniref:hypothetical protein n=1 Tax=Acidovorax soli TaxID=592050 RepID=UPI00289349AE|nr:hypothetical protein [Acidovorax soli]